MILQIIINKFGLCKCFIPQPGEQHGTTPHPVHGNGHLLFRGMLKYKDQKLFTL